MFVILRVFPDGMFTGRRPVAEASGVFRRVSTPDTQGRDHGVPGRPGSVTELARNIYTSTHTHKHT